MYKVLFLCTGNSARSQMAEVLLKRFGKGKYEVYSAGSEPNQQVHPLALKVILKNQYVIDGLKPKNMMELIDNEFDFVITLCDKMLENCPIFPSQPIYAHWGMPDPVQFEGSDVEKEEYFSKTFREISNRIHMFLCIDIEKLERQEIEKELGEIANTWKYIR